MRTPATVAGWNVSAPADLRIERDAEPCDIDDGVPVFGWWMDGEFLGLFPLTADDLIVEAAAAELALRDRIDARGGDFRSFNG